VFSIRFEGAADVPLEIRAEARLRLHKLAGVFGIVPPDHHPMWEEMKDGASIDVRGWQVMFSVDPAARNITVTDIRGRPESLA
jgi:hypothetical protein